MPKGEATPQKGWRDYPPPLLDGKCLRWQGPHSPEGYGRLGVKAYGTSHAHRAAWIRAHGPIPENLVIDHVAARGCKFRDCVNVEHLEPVTQKVNMERGGAQFGDWGQADKTECPAGHPYDEINTYTYKTKDGSTERHCRTCRRAAKQRYKAKKRSSCGN